MLHIVCKFNIGLSRTFIIPRFNCLTLSVNFQIMTTFLSMYCIRLSEDCVQDLLRYLIMFLIVAQQLGKISRWGLSRYFRDKISDWNKLVS